ncbi:hypothetical protein K2Q02_01365 [Patescibacteria group bacterium]|nr:hypothetical protein [Patescibacteria group bacterium]
MYDLLFNSIAYADSLDTLLFKINKVVLNPLIEMSFVIAIGVFLFGVMEFIRGADNEEKRRDGKQHMLWGVIGLLIMLTVFGLITLLMSTFGIQGVKINNNEQTFKPQPLQELKLP